MMFWMAYGSASGGLLGSWSSCWGSDSKWTKNNVKLKRDLAVSAAEDLCGGIPSLR